MINAIWENKDYHEPIIITGVAGFHEDLWYFEIYGSKTGIPENEVRLKENNLFDILMMKKKFLESEINKRIFFD